MPRTVRGRRVSLPKRPAPFKRMISVRVSNTTYRVPAHHLTAISGHFRTIVPYYQSRPQTLDLRGTVEDKTWRQFLKWSLKNHFAVEGSENPDGMPIDPSYDPKETVLWMILMYLLGWRWDISLLMKDGLRELVDCITQWDILGSMPWDDDLVAQVFEDLDEDDPLHRLLVDAICSKTDEDFWDMEGTLYWPQKLVSAVLRKYTSIVGFRKYAPAGSP